VCVPPLQTKFVSTELEGCALAAEAQRVLREANVPFATRRETDDTGRWTHIYSAPTPSLLAVELNVDCNASDATPRICLCDRWNSLPHYQATHPAYTGDCNNRSAF
jgi:hypothetical protein